MSISVTFLGTSSGGGPSESRNCSSLVCDMLEDQSLWMVDCAEGTVRQFSLQPPHAKPHVRSSRFLDQKFKLDKLSTQADHIMGIVPFLRNVLFPPSTSSNRVSGDSTSRPNIEIYGPAGLRLFVRQIMKMTLTCTSDKYVVHELLTPDDSVTPCDPPPAGAPSATFHITEPNIVHCNEVPGLDIRASPDGLWRAITQASGKMSPIVVDAGPILHRDPCVGYVFYEARFPFRKLVILGDTYNPEAIIPLCINPSPSLLIHEATDSHISHHADPSGKLSRRSAEAVLEKALSRGHSVPEMAGSFAKLVNARALVLNHIGGRFPAPRNPRDHSRQKIMRDIEKKASVAWGAKKHVTAAWDFMRVDVPFDDIPNHATHTLTHVIERSREQDCEQAEDYVELEYPETYASTSQTVQTPVGGGEAGPLNRKRRR